MGDRSLIENAGLRKHFSSYIYARRSSRTYRHYQQASLQLMGFHLLERYSVGGFAIVYAHCKQLQVGMLYSVVPSRSGVSQRTPLLLKVAWNSLIHKEFRLRVPIY